MVGKRSGSSTLVIAKEAGSISRTKLRWFRVTSHEEGSEDTVLRTVVRVDE